MARYQLILAYDGTDFQGFQRQGRTRTVQGEVETSLRRLNWQERTIVSAGRTDTGVHAEGQVIAFDLDWPHSPEELQHALNAFLPGDVSVLAVRQAPVGFHPRYDALSRCYQYRLYCQPARNPLRERYAWRIWPPVEFERLEQAAALLVGEHDFTAFGRAMHPGETTVRKVLHTNWAKVGQDGFCFTVEANAFLYHMVRRMVFLQVQVGQGRLALEDLEAAIRQNRRVIPGLAKPQGLTLFQVRYPSEQEILE
ncbi:MAG TPA: tRNA pseudouridine(38-40) synthase TruA [Longilinea sp.]|nr:tRNA pseudouridine(38-40) synthase TruA [Longilinea sp.]